MKKYKKDDFIVPKEVTNIILRIFSDYNKYRKIMNEKINASDYINYSSLDMSREKVTNSIIHDEPAAAVERAEKEWIRQQKAENIVRIIDCSIKRAAEYARPDMRNKIENVLKKSLIEKIRREYLDCSKEMLSKYRQIAVYFAARDLNYLTRVSKKSHASNAGSLSHGYSYLKKKK